MADNPYEHRTIVEARDDLDAMEKIEDALMDFKAAAYEERRWLNCHGEMLDRLLEDMDSLWDDTVGLAQRHARAVLSPED